MIIDRYFEGETQICRKEHAPSNMGRHMPFHADLGSKKPR